MISSLFPLLVQVVEDAAQRICGGVSTILRPMRGIGETEVVLINEELGY